MNRRYVPVAIVAAIIFVGILLFSNATFVTIRPGERGLLFQRFGGGLDKEHVYAQGFHVIAPWNDMIVYNVQKQENQEQMDVLSSNGLAINVDFSIRYRPIESKLGFLHEEIGPEYLQKVVIPEVRASARRVIGKYTPEELYSTKREAIQQDIEAETRQILVQNFVDLDALLIRSIQLPDKIKQAIERKLEQEQQAQEYEFRLVKEQKEAERKQIEAKGIQEFQRIVTEGISDKLLKWKGIEATQELAKSENSKMVIIGGGNDGLPVILNE
ncbi:Regulator of protease activity HflC, stomatin/prohibitin superfamily [Catalinimonas alkaloidigena]|uniref:Regulator of protease activity HflC, stomatin/prohibitin superfamily n=1 Tax=Catalinimonas alkaloidigena TaxID=1075417 RepID=A0A1G9DYD7_9BACT|nr:prohibitin family protein [Catalinimonas alkaloidigena]SDK68848.1 Regulator of protease activity HflC, stomatin/prohibitin superfamily [Catalinimonas alkaloidigena]